jgi:hypothetical protein
MSGSRLLVLIASLGFAGCTSQAFAQKTPDGKVYLNGSTSFLLFSSSFIKRCTESGTTLTCEKLTIVDAGGDDDSDDTKAKPRKRSSSDDSSDDSDDKPTKKPPSDDSDDSDSGDKPKKKPKKSDDE